MAAIGVGGVPVSVKKLIKGGLSYKVKFKFKLLTYCKGTKSGLEKKELIDLALIDPKF